MTRRVLITATFLISSCAHGAQKPSPPAQSASAATCATSPDDAAIYSAALTKVILKDRNDRRQVVLLSQTSSTYPPGLAVFTALAKSDRTELLDLTNPATKADFDAKAKLSCDLTANPGLSAGVVFVSPKER